MTIINRHLLTVVSMIALCCTAFEAHAQKAAIKTNLLYDATATVNLGLEIALAQKWTLDLSGNLNAWNMPKGDHWKHWMVQPEFRYWFCSKFAGHFLGFHVLGGQYNIGNFSKGMTDTYGFLRKLSDKRYQGWGVGVGIAYGYNFILGKHWGLELEVGGGYVYTRYDVYECKDCGKKIESDTPHHYLGPTKIALNLVYEF